MTGWMWILINFVGPFLLLAVIVWAYLRNRRSSPGEIERSERGARELREEIERDEARDGAP
jgi:hypothetical protein